MPSAPQPPSSRDPAPERPSHLRAIAGGRGTSPADRSDAQLVGLVLDGDRSALQDLFAKHYDRARGLAYRLLADDTELEDVVQEAFIQAMKSLGTLKNPDAFSGWLRTIVVNVVRKKLRGRKRLRLFGMMSKDEFDGDMQVSPSASPEIAAQLRAVYACLGRLEPDSQACLVLTRVEEHSIVETAEIMGISLSTAKRLKKRAEYEFQIELRRGQS